MGRLSQYSVDEVARRCAAAYEQLAAGGRPAAREWTVLAAVEQHAESAGGARVVALGTGSWCAGEGALTAGAGRRLHDCHAEVLARRALLRHLYDQLARCQRGETAIFRRDGVRFRLLDDVDFVFYSSQLPCGDASILPRDNCAEGRCGRKRDAEDGDVCDSVGKRCRLESDIHRTGAKCLPDAAPDPLLPGAYYHLTGQVRTKPGRGERTLSVSCSDKMARWIHVGIQGALLDMLCGPIYIKHFIFGGGTPYSKESLERALLKRKSNANATISSQYIPEFYQSSLQFQYLKLDKSMRACPCSIIWIPSIRCLEVAVQGRKQGLTKKTANLPKNSLCVTKYKLYEKFMEILKKDVFVAHSILGNNLMADIPYNEMKKKATEYLEKWSIVKENFFGMWTRKPDIWNFCLDVWNIKNDVETPPACSPLSERVAWSPGAGGAGGAGDDGAVLSLPNAARAGGEPK